MIIELLSCRHAEGRRRSDAALVVKIERIDRNPATLQLATGRETGVAAARQCEYATGDRIAALVQRACDLGLEIASC